MISDQKKDEFKQVIGHRLVHLVMLAVRRDAAETLDRIREELDIISSTAEMYFSENKTKVIHRNCESSDYQFPNESIMNAGF